MKSERGGDPTGHSHHKGHSSLDFGVWGRGGFRPVLPRADLSCSHAPRIAWRAALLRISTPTSLNDIDAHVLLVAGGSHRSYVALTKLHEQGCRYRIRISDSCCLLTQFRTGRRRWSETHLTVASSHTMSTTVMNRRVVTRCHCSAQRNSPDIFSI